MVSIFRIITTVTQNQRKQGSPRTASGLAEFPELISHFRSPFPIKSWTQQPTVQRWWIHELPTAKGIVRRTQEIEQKGASLQAQLVNDNVNIRPIHQTTTEENKLESLQIKLFRKIKIAVIKQVLTYTVVTLRNANSTTSTV